MLAAFEFQRTLIKLAFHDHEISCPVTGICEPTGGFQNPDSPTPSAFGVDLTNLNVILVKN